MAYTTIKKPSDYFNTKLYTGNGSTQSVTGVGFQPDFTWVKNRTDGSTPNLIVDVIRGYGTSGKTLTTNETTSEQSNSSTDRFVDNGATADGFTVGNSTYTNGSSKNYASWNWKANGAGVANTDGSISSTVSANTTSGFSIVSYTGNGNGNSTIGHGLGATPKFIIVKNRTTAQEWGTYSPSFVSASDPNIVYLSKTSAQADDTNVWGTSASFNNNTFTVGDWNGSNQSGSSFIAYCFAEKTGYSKFGSYTGNGNADGTFVYTGFKPSFILMKRSDTGNSYDNWYIFDNKRDGFNPNNKKIAPNISDAESSDTGLFDLLSNGFKLRTTNSNNNGSGGNFIYMAFAEEPLVGDNPCTAR